MNDTRLAVDREEPRAHVRLDPRTMAVLTGEADRLHMTVPALIRQLVTKGLDELGLLK